MSENVKRSAGFKHQAPVPKRGPWRTVILGLLLLAAIGMGALAIGTRGFTRPASEIFIPSPQTVFHKDRLLVLLLGIDYNYDNNDQPYSKDARSDTIMAASLDLNTHRINLVSVPRDMAAEVNGHERKINEAYAQGGQRLAETVVGSWLGLPKGTSGHYFDRYVVVKINALKELINAIGGIDLRVEKTMNYDDTWGHLHIHLKPGFQHLNGEQAVGYSRFRHDEEGDVGRIRRQQQVIRATVDKLKRNKFNDLVHIGDLIGVINRNVTTDMNDTEKESLAWAFRGVNTNELKGAQVPYVDTKDTPYAGEVLIPDEAAKAKLAAMLIGPPAPVAAASPAQIAQILPATVHVEVRNGTGVRGMAARMARELRRAGYHVDAIGNADATTYTTTVIETHSHVAGVGEKLRSQIALPAAEVNQATATPGTSSATDATIIVGKDFVGKSAQ